MNASEAKAILSEEPEVLESVWFKQPQSWLELRKIKGPGGLPMRWQSRQHTIHGVSQWEHAG